MQINTTTVITKAVRWILLGLLLAGAVCPAAAQESMIPDDFDWGINLQDWENAFGEGWYTPTQEDYNSWQEPIVYNWSGQTYQIDPWQSVSVPQSNNYGDYVPVQVYDDQWQNWGSSSQTSGTSDDDGWFYQNFSNFYDEYEDWGLTGSAKESAYVSGFVGYAQSYNLDCEARSAVDLAAYFGVNISHGEFLNSLPKSDDPNEGFVGYFNDARGNVPPASYGVYQEPVAALLRQYGLNAYGAYGYTRDALKNQISSGKPVMVWVVGNTEIGYSRPYTPASNGRTTYVVPFQHTVVVIGYDANGVTIADGAMRYARDWNTFLVSWGALGNRAVYVR